jgi:hypothetical protein
MKIGDVLYIAGFFDGEGHIGINKGTGGSFSLRMEMTQKDRGVLEYIKKVSGIGKIYKRKDGFYILRFGAREARVFLNNIFPYLRVKKPQAEVAKLFNTVTKDDSLSLNQRRQKQAFFKQVISDLNQGRA